MELDQSLTEANHDDQIPVDALFDHKAREIGADFGAYRPESSELYELLASDNRYSEYENLRWFMGDEERRA